MSHIKFGGFDNGPEFLQEGERINFVRTINEGSWNLNVSSIAIGSTYFNKLSNGRDRHVALMPNLPFLYIPDGDFK